MKHETEDTRQLIIHASRFSTVEFIITVEKIVEAEHGSDSYPLANLVLRASCFLPVEFITTVDKLVHATEHGSLTRRRRCSFKREFALHASRTLTVGGFLRACLSCMPRVLQPLRAYHHVK